MEKKVVKLVRTLSLDKEIIAKLDEEQLGEIQGGQQEIATQHSSCAVFSCNPDNCLGQPTDN
jgi:hypothetical protein